MTKPLFALMVLSIAAGTGCASNFTKKAKSNIAVVMVDHHVHLQSCYAKALKRDPATRGYLDLSFEVGGKRGSFRNVAVEDTNIDDQRMVNCVLRNTARLRMGKKMPATIRVGYRLNFRPRTASN